MLLENDNKKFIRTLSNNCLKANKIRNAIALLAIMLTALLFTAVATILQGTQISVREQTIRQSGPRFMASIKFTTAEKTKELMEDPLWENVSAERVLWKIVNPELMDISVNMAWMEETYAKNSYMEIEEGHMPEEEYEFACDTEILRLLGIPEETGTKVNIQYLADEGVKEETMTLSGYWEGEKYEQTAEVMVSEAFLEKRIDESTIAHDASVPGSYCIRGSFATDEDVEGQLNTVIANAGFDPDAERGEEGFVVHHTNPAYENRNEMGGGMIAAAVFGVLMILLAGYLIIYNIFRISILKDIRLYGQLKTIGTSPKQLKYMVKRQGYLLALAGIPAGLILGWLLGNVLLPLIMASTTVGESVFIMPHPAVWVVSAAFTFLTVWISCGRPGKLAARVSPVEALRYQDGEEGGKAKKKGRDSHHRIFQMASANLKRNRGKTVLVVMSIALSLILLNSVLGATGCFDKEIYVRRNAVTDFIVHSGNYGNFSVDDYTKTLNPKLSGKLSEMENVKNFGEVYCHILPPEQVTDIEQGSLINITEINGKRTNIVTEGTKEEFGNAVSEFDWRRTVYGWSRNILNDVTLIEGELDYDKLNSGNYVIMAGFLGDDGLYAKESQEFHAGDKIRLDIGGEEKEYEVLAVAGAVHDLTLDSSLGGYEAVVFSKEQFQAIFPDDTDPLVCAFDAEESTFAEVNSEAEQITSQLNSSMITRLSEEREFDEIQSTYRIVGIVLAAVFAVIGILNLINVILTGAIARQNEFAVMRSIGMSQRQLKKLFIYEGILYALLAGAVGITASAAVSLTAVKAIVSNWWFARYSLSVLPAFEAALICSLLAAGIAWVIDRMWNKGSIVEKLRRIE